MVSLDAQLQGLTTGINTNLKNVGYFCFFKKFY